MQMSVNPGVSRSKDWYGFKTRSSTLGSINTDPPISQHWPFQKQQWAVYWLLDLSTWTGQKAVLGDISALGATELSPWCVLHSWAFSQVFCLLCVARGACETAGLWQGRRWWFHMHFQSWALLLIVIHSMQPAVLELEGLLLQDVRWWTRAVSAEVVETWLCVCLTACTVNGLQHPCTLTVLPQSTLPLLFNNYFTFSLS